MKKNSTEHGSRKRRTKSSAASMTIGIDLGDRTSRFCVLNDAVEVTQEGSAATTRKGFAQRFGAIPRVRIAVEVGTHSPWVTRLLTSLGHEVIVANARQLKLISTSSRKDDRLDARLLARLARVDPQLLRPIRHRSERAQLHLVEIRGRAALVESGTLVRSLDGSTRSKIENPNRHWSNLLITECEWKQGGHGDTQTLIHEDQLLGLESWIPFPVSLRKAGAGGFPPHRPSAATPARGQAPLRDPPKHAQIVY